MLLTEHELKADTVCASVPEVQVFWVFQASVDELFKLAVDFWHELRERKLLREGKLEEKSKRIMIKRAYIWDDT